MKRACVIGWPIAHSRSPLIHGHWLKTYGIEGAYTREPVRPEALSEFISSLAQRGLCGCNVTVPHKEAAFALAHIRHPAAVAVQAANTLWLEDGHLHADNTDTYGYMAHLDATVPDWHRAGAPVSILGAGGAARAIVQGLLDRGVARIDVFNRSMERAETLASHFGPRIAARPWSERAAGSKNACLLVNTTTLGMKGSQPLEFDVGMLPPGCVVSDIVYVPLETSLLQAARARGMRTVDGLGMLLHQAVPGFERWFGRRPEVTPALYELIAADIRAST